MKIKSTTYLIALLFLSSMAIPIAAHADVSQTDYSTYGGAGFLNGYVQTLGQLAGTQIQSITLRVHSTTVSPYNYGQIRVLICTSQDCGNSSIVGMYEAYTSSGRSTVASYYFTAGSYDGTVNVNFQYAKDLISGNSATYIPIDSTKYYAIWAWNSDGNVSRYEGSASDSAYTGGTCLAASAIYVSNPNASPSNPCSAYSAWGISDMYFSINGASGYQAPPANGQSQVTYFSPADGTTTPSTTVTFTYQAYIAASDIGFFLGKQMTFYVQGQPVGLGTYFLDKVQATTSGYFNFSTTTVMSPGNYILNACVEDSELGGLVGGFDNLNPWANPCQYHQFVVGTSTFIGNLFQNGVTTVQGQLNNIAATSSLAILGNSCNPFSGFDIVQCFYALLIPTSSQMQDTMNSFYSDFLTRVPWGYGSVAVADLLGYGTTATTSLSSSNLTITLPNTGIFATATSTSVLKGKTLTFINWTVMSSTTVQNYWAPALSPLNNFLNIMMGGGFIFWLYHFFKKMKP